MIGMWRQVNPSDADVIPAALECVTPSPSSGGTHIHMKRSMWRQNGVIGNGPPSSLAGRLQISMKQQPARPPKAATPASWKPGQSGNPRGRPRCGLALAERIRERLDPDVVIDLAIAVASDETLSASVRLAALLPLVDRGYMKPPTTIDANVTSGNAPQRDYSSMPLDERRALLDRLRSLPVLSGGHPADVTPIETD